jgi:hypothetical protein
MAIKVVTKMKVVYSVNFGIMWYLTRFLFSSFFLSPDNRNKCKTYLLNLYISTIFVAYFLMCSILFYLCWMPLKNARRKLVLSVWFPICYLKYPFTCPLITINEMAQIAEKVFHYVPKFTPWINKLTNGVQD